jgi:hypothetical protein
LFGAQKAAFDTTPAIVEQAYGERRKKGGCKRKRIPLDMLIITLGYYRDYRIMGNIAFDCGGS